MWISDGEKGFSLEMKDQSKQENSESCGDERKRENSESCGDETKRKLTKKKPNYYIQYPLNFFFLKILSSTIYSTLFTPLVFKGKSQPALG